MALDIAAIQSLYGPNTTTGAGATTYTFMQLATTIQTIWDASGIDTIDASDALQFVRIDLNPGSLSSIGGTNNVGLAYLYNNQPNAYIENAIGSGLSDQMTGNAIANDLHGGGGSDDIWGGGGSDYIDGGNGNDTAHYRDARGFYSITREGDTVTVLSLGAANEGFDVLVGVEWLEFRGGARVNVQSIPDSSAGTNSGGSASDGGIAPTGGGSNGSELTGGTVQTGPTVVGNDTSQHLYGTNAAETLQGLGGDDILTGYAGQDTFDGGAGNDTVDYSYQPTSVNGTINLAAGTAAFAGYHTETLISIENVWSGAGNDSIVGTSGDNDLRGGPGSDTLTGGGGNDLIYGDWRFSDQGGIDTAILSYSFGSGYTVTGTADALRIVGSEGDDRFFNVENFQFADGVTRTAAEVLAAGISFQTALGGNQLTLSQSMPATDQSDPRVDATTNEAGETLFVWTRTFSINGFLASELIGQLRAADGTLIGGNFLINQSQHRTASAPDVGVSADGRFIVAWEDGELFQGSLTTSVRGAIVNSNATVVSEFAVHPRAFNNEDNSAPSVISVTGGGFIISWHSRFGVGGGASDVRYQVFDAAGNPTGSQQSLGIDTPLPQSTASAVALSTGEVVVAWATDSGDMNNSPIVNGLDVHFRILSSAGSVIGPEFGVTGTISAAVGMQFQPTVAALPSGRFVITWTDTDSNGSGVRGRIFNADGTAHSSSFLVNSTTVGEQVAPTVSALPNGHFLVVWMDDSRVATDTSGTAIRAQAFDQNGQRVGQEIVVNTVTVGNQISPTVTAVGTDRWLVGWSEFGSVNSQLVLLEAVGPTNAAPTAHDGTFMTSESGMISGQLLADNGSGAASEPDGDSLGITAINTSATNVGHTIALASGARLVVNADGRFVYNPNGAFNSLTEGQSTTDSFTYAISDGFGHTSTATVTVTINGAANGLNISGNSAAETITGTSANDHIDGGGGADTIAGAAGYDWLQGGDGDDSLSGGADDDVLEGGANNDRLSGGTGVDVLEGGDGNDTLDGGSGADELNGGAGNDTVSYLNSAAGLTASLTDQSGNTGEAVGDSYISIENLTGSTFNDVLTGNAADNTFEGLGGVDNFDGAAGSDTVSYASFTRVDASALYDGVNVDLVSQNSWDGTSVDFFVSIENAIGSNRSDTLAGNTADNILEGGVGVDFLYGEGGSDTASYRGMNVMAQVDLGNQWTWVNDDSGPGLGAMDFLRSIENVIGSGVGDILIGDSGNNVFEGLGGLDVIYGGAPGSSLNGSDTVSFASAYGGVYVDLSAAHSFGFGYSWDGSAMDFYQSVENAAGSAFADTLIGDSGTNILDGRAGNDQLIGNGGDDHFRYLTSGTGSDTITDFDSDATGGQDRIDVSGRGFTAASVGGAGSAIAVTNNGSGGTTITIGADTIRLTGVNITTVDATDFIF